ncbi:MAG TPA: hypothetical protein PKL29_05770 [Methanothrix sp.]|nr:hypothetical protein [Methanothrix sp.]
MAKKNMKLVEMGRTGLTRFGGYISEEWLPELQGRKGAEVYKRMADSDAIIGGYLFAIKEIAKSVPWFAVPADSSDECQEDARFLESCIYDMSSSWPSTLDEILSMLVFGWSYFEKVFKIRRGPKQKDPRFHSQYKDGRIGWAKWAPRAQESLNEWIYDEDTDTLMGMSQIPAPDYQERRIPLDKSIHFVTTSTKGNPEGRSTLRNARRSCYMKTNIEDLEGIGIERDLAGYPTLYIPLEVFKRDTDKAEEAYNDFMDVISNIRRDEAEGILLPAVFDANGNRLYEFKLLSSSGTRQFDTSRVINRYDTRIALTVMADFLLLGQQKQGSYALSDTKSKMFYQSLMSLLDNIAETINTQAVPELFELNGCERDELPYLAHGKAEPVNLEALGNFLGRLTDLGMVLDDRLENHLRAIADMPLRDAKYSSSRSRTAPALALKKPQQQKKPGHELMADGKKDENVSGEEVAA